MIWPVVAYAPKAATKPSIAAQPLNFSASGVIGLKIIYVKECNETSGLAYGGQPNIQVKMIYQIKKINQRKPSSRSISLLRNA